MLYQNIPNSMRSQIPGNCGCETRDGRMDQYPLAMAYVPWQGFSEVYPLDQAFHAGTIFPCLDLPFLCSSQACNRRGGCP